MGFPSRIYLTGFMASGKSTVGRVLADRLGHSFLDLDALIEDRAGEAIPSIFETRGEPFFRKLEASVLAEASDRESVVIATGGGALASDAGLAIAAGSGLVVYLEASLDSIAERLRRDPTFRPMLQQDSGAHEMERIARLLELRRPYYERADLRIDVSSRLPEEIADEIIRRMQAD